MSDWPIVLLTAALVLVTGYYAWQNRKMAIEMRHARMASVLPKVVPSYEGYGGAVGFPRVVNVGPGAALDVDVTLSFQPGEGEARRWRVALLTPGEFREFTLPRELMDTNDLTSRYRAMKLIGQCRDALGEAHTIDEEFDLAEWWQLAVQAHERIERGPKSPVVRELERIRQALESRGEPPVL